MLIIHQMFLFVENNVWHFDGLLSHQIREEFQLSQTRKIDSIPISHHNIAQLHLLKEIYLQDEQGKWFLIK